MRKHVNRPDMSERHDQYNDKRQHPRCSSEPGSRESEAPWMDGFGTLSDLADENRRILDVIEQEFEMLAPEAPA